MKNILVIITTSMVSYGGLATVALNYYRQLNHDIFQMDFASTNDITQEISKEFENNKSKYIKLPKRGSMQYEIELFKLLKKYDIVHVHGNSATTIAELLPALFSKVDKRIIHIHSTKCSHVVLNKILKPIFCKCYTNAIACSKAAGSWIFVEGNYTVLNNAIDLDEYCYNSEKRKQIRDYYQLKETNFIIGHVGKFYKPKNHLFLLDVFNEILKIKEQAKLMLVGDGELKKDIEEKAIRLGIKENIIFCGMQNSAKDFYSAFDCVIFPSLWEGFGLAILEAQANGLDCIVSDVIVPEVEVAKSGMQRISLLENASVWAEFATNIELNDRRAKSNHCCKLISEQGYDIKKNVSVLEDIYLYQ